MIAKQVGIGLAIGDETVVASGWDGAQEWVVTEPAVVSAPSNAARVELLLGGHEAVASGAEPLLETPRRWGLVAGDPAVATELWAALLTTLRQQIPLGEWARCDTPPVLALPHTVSPHAQAVLIAAAAQAGWGEVRTISELTALAALQAADGDALTVHVGDGLTTQQGDFRLQPTSDGVTLWLTALRALPVPGTAPAAAVARGAAYVAAAGAGLHVAVARDLALTIGILGGDGTLTPLVDARQTGTLVRALVVSSPDGALLRLVVAPTGDVAAGQLLAEVPLESAMADPTSPWLLTLMVAEGLVGTWSIRSPQGVVRSASFRVRLP